MEEQREESEVALSSETQTLDGEDAKTVVDVLVDSGVSNVNGNDENPNGGGGDVGTVEAAVSEIKSDSDGESHGVAGEEESENEVTDEDENCEVEDKGDAEQSLVDGETLSVADQEKESSQNPGNETTGAKHSESSQLSEGETNKANTGNESAAEISREDVNQKEGEAMEVDYAADESTDASMVETRDVPIAEADGNDGVTGTVESAGSENPNSHTEDAAPGEVEPLEHNGLFDPSSDITNFIDFSGVSSWSGNIQDLKTETGNVSLKEDKKVIDMAEEVATVDATLNAESNHNQSLSAEGIENESDEARVAFGEESPAAATECPKEASDAITGSDENQEDKENQQVAMREEDGITHETPDQKEDTEMEENSNNSDFANDGTESDIKTNGVNRKADVLSEDSSEEGRKTVSLAKVSYAQTPSFKIGASIARAASQMAGSPSVLKGSNKNLSVESFVSQLHRAATDPVKENVLSDHAASFFLDFRNSSASQQVPPEKVSRKRGRPANSNAGGTEAFEFEEMGDTYWTDRVIHNGGEEQTPPAEKGNYQVVPVELKPAQVKKTRRPYKRRQSQITIPLPSPLDKPADFDENAPAELIMKFSETDTIPPEKSLSKMFRHFGPIKESQTEVDEENNRARVVYRKGTDAEVAYNSAGRFSIFGTKAVNYELSYTITEAFKVQPYVVSLAEEDATLCPS